MDILVNVVNQKLKIATNLKNLISGTQEFINFVFNLSSDWDGLMTFAQFQQDGIAYNKYLDEDNCVSLPPEIGAGSFTIMLYGTNESVIGTTNYLTLTINENILISDASSTEITETLYQQLINKINNVVSAYDFAVKNGFTGTEQEWIESLKGEPGRNGIDGHDGAPGKDGVDGAPGQPGKDGESGVYIGTEKPTAANHPVWVNPEGDLTWPIVDEEARAGVEELKTRVDELEQNGGTGGSGSSIGVKAEGERLIFSVVGTGGSVSYENVNEVEF